MTLRALLVLCLVGLAFASCSNFAVPEEVVGSNFPVLVDNTITTGEAEITISDPESGNSFTTNFDIAQFIASDEFFEASTGDVVLWATTGTLNEFPYQYEVDGVIPTDAQLTGAYSISVDDAVLCTGEILLRGKPVFPRETPTSEILLPGVILMQSQSKGATFDESLNATIFESTSLPWKYLKDLTDLETGDTCLERQSAFSLLSDSYESIYEAASIEALEKDFSYSFSRTVLDDAVSENIFSITLIVKWEDATVEEIHDENPDNDLAFAVQEWEFHLTTDLETGTFSYAPSEVVEMAVIVGDVVCAGLPDRVTDSCLFTFVPGEEILTGYTCTPGELPIYVYALIVLGALLVFFAIIGLIFFCLCRKGHPEKFHVSYGSGQEGKLSSQEMAILKNKKGAGVKADAPLLEEGGADEVSEKSDRAESSREEEESGEAESSSGEAESDE